MKCEHKRKKKTIYTEIVCADCGDVIEHKVWRR